MGIFNFIFLNLVVGVSAWLLSRYFFYFESITDYFISFSIVFLSQIILTLQLLGVFNSLYLKNIFMLNLCILLIVYLIIKMSKRKAGDNLGNRFKSTINNLKLNKLDICILSIILGFALVKFIINLVNPPFGWDCLNYHFTFPVEWLKNGNLDVPIVVSDDFAPSYYPVNGSLFFFWLILPFRSVFLADLGSFPFFILSGLAVYAVSKKIGLDRRLSFYATALFLLIPNFFKQLEIAYVDIMVCALFLITVYYILKLNDSFQLKNIILAGISIGLLTGTKTLALLYSITLFLAVCYLCVLKIKKKGVIYGLIFLALIVLGGGFSYIRNFLWTGNPLYPIDVQLLGKTIFRGVIDRVNYSAHFVSGDYKISKILFHEGLGLQTLLFILPGMLCGLLVSFIKEKRKLSLFRAYFFCLPFILWFIWRYIIPLANVRYFYPALAVAMIIGFYIFSSLKISLKIIQFLTVICVFASLTELSGHMELFVSLILSAILFVILYKNYSKFISVIPIAFILFIIILPFLEEDYVKNEFARYKNTPFWKEACSAWYWLNEHTWYNNISYVGRPVPLPLYGSRFKNNVYYTSVNNIHPAKIHFFKNSRYTWGYDFKLCHQNYEAENNYRDKANYQLWLNNLKVKKTDYLFIYSLHQIKDIEFSMEDKWASSHPKVFDLVFKNDSIHIYKIKNGKK